MSEIIAKTASGNYQVIIRNGSLERLGEIASKVCRGHNAVVVTDENVSRLYLDKAVRFMHAAGFSARGATVPAGEASKSPDMLLHLYSCFHAAGLSRTDPVIALGGGVVGDLGGFAAATYLRGVPLIQVPTTLLAQVDSSIGGKTGIDLPFGKNLAGAFYQPSAVIMDPKLLESLSCRQVAEGMAEVIKYGLIRDLPMLEQVEKNSDELEWILKRCVRIKIDIVSRDEKDSGERMLLNFGHTIGHAIEKVTDYSSYTHGEAVAIGMVLAASVGEQLKLTEPGTSDRIRTILLKYRLPVSADLSADRIIEAVLSDKKHLAGKLHFVLLKKAGDAFLHPMDRAQMETALREVLPHG